MTRPTLISHHLCPYVQRAAIAMAEKGMDFTRVDIDLARKPDWFLAISPLGKTPVLDVGGAAIFESSAILEYIEDVQAPALHPADPVERARHRGWIEFGSSVLNDIAALYNAADEAAFQRAQETLAEKIRRLEDVVAGPWFGGERFSLVDAVFGPVFRYFEVFDRIGNFAGIGALPKVAAWRAALAERASVRDAVAADYPERLSDFVRARGSHLSRLMTASAPAW